MFNNSKKEYIYPKIWNDDDIIKFKYYLKEAKEMYNDLPEDIIELCVERQINEEKGLLEPIDHSKIKDLEITTPQFEEFKTEIEIETEA
jgi:hypothetical protein